ncbi:hypothetical protein GW17_00031834 [Ensete ventricosum]|nr:hypothetical protein GW17_00031834 [Ensete ventricosum]
MAADMESMAAAIGVSIPVLRFLFCFVATTPVSFVWRVVPGTLPRHLYAALSGRFLLRLLQPPFPHPQGHGLRFHAPRPPLCRPHHLLHRLRVPHRMVRSRSDARPVELNFLLYPRHVYYMSGDALKEGGIDATGNEVLLALIKFFIN